MAPSSRPITRCDYGIQERGCSFYFSARALFEFLARSDLLAVVRAHEFEEDGFMFHFDGPEYRELDQRACRDLPPLMTVFSAPNYCDTHGNKVSDLAPTDALPLREPNSLYLRCRARIW